MEWIGLYTDYATFRLGLSPRRSAWMCTWVGSLAASGKVTQKVFEQGLGRLGFSASALLWERPFLGPLYSWNAAVRGKRGTFKIPAMLRAILLFLTNRIKAGGDLHTPPPLGRPDGEHLLFLRMLRLQNIRLGLEAIDKTARGRLLSGFLKK